MKHFPDQTEWTNCGEVVVKRELCMAAKGHATSCDIHSKLPSIVVDSSLHSMYTLFLYVLLCFSHKSINSSFCLMAEEDSSATSTPEATAYVRVCREHDAHPNSSLKAYLLSSSGTRLLVSSPTSMVSPLTVLHLHKSYIGDLGTVCLGKCMLESLPFLRALSLAYNGVGNDGVAALCTAIADKCQPKRLESGVCSPLAVVDLSHNPKITRVGGQSLLNATSRIHNHLALVHLVGTRVTEYYEVRITRHAQAHYDTLSEAAQQLIYDDCTALGLIEESRPGSVLPGQLASSVGIGRSGSAAPMLPGSVASDALRNGSSTGPHFLDDDGDGLSDHSKYRSPTALVGRHSSTGGASFDALAVRRAESVNPMFQSNAPFDEAWYADADGMAPAAITTSGDLSQPANRNPSVMEVTRPSAPSGLESILYSATPDFLHVFPESSTLLSDGLSKRYTITTMPNRERTVYGFTTPSLDEVEIFSFVEAFKPKSIELPTKFLFPGSIDYMAAVHAPDPMLHPALPSPFLSTMRTPAAAAKKLPVPAPPVLSHLAGNNAGSVLYPSGATTPPAGGVVPNPPPAPGFTLSLGANASSTPTTAAAQAAGATQEAADAEGGRSMFWSFFHSATTPVGTPRDHNNGTTTTSRTPNQHTPRSHMPLVSESQASSAPLAGSQQVNSNSSLRGPLSIPPLHEPVQRTHSSAASSSTATPVATTPEDGHLGTPTLNHTSGLDGSPAASPNGSFSSLTFASAAAAASASREANETVTTPASSSAALDSRRSTLTVATSGYTGGTRLDALHLMLGKINDGCARSKALLSSRFASYPLPAPASVKMDTRTKSLSELLTDPLWTPDQPTRPSQIVDYCYQHKLKFDYVSRERRKLSGADTREYYLQRIIRPSITDNLSAGAMNTSGTLLVTSNYDMTCKVWDLETGKKLHTLRGHTGHLSDCAWNAPICDKVITSSFDRTLRVWDVSSGDLLHTLRGHELEVVCVAVSVDGLECASGAMDDIAIIWDIERGTEKFTLAGHTAEVIALDFSPVGGLLASGSMDETVRIWNTRDGSCVRVFEGHTAEVGQVKFNCFGNVVLSGSIDSTCKLWDIKTGRHKTLRGHTHEVVDCDFSPDGWICASASDDGTVRIWDVLSGGCLQLIVGHERGVCRLAFTATGKELITGSLDTTAKVWNVESGECKQTLRGHKGLVLVTYNAASEKILTLSRDNTCRIWQLEPELNTMFHSVAMAICSHPTLYSDLVFSPSLPPQLCNYLHRVYRKVFRTEESVLSAPSPAPHMRSPEQEETVDLEEEASAAGAAGANTTTTTAA